MSAKCDLSERPRIHDFRDPSEITPTAQQPSSPQRHTDVLGPDAESNVCFLQYNPKTTRCRERSVKSSSNGPSRPGDSSVTLNRSVPTDTLLPQVICQGVAAVAWLTKIFEFSEHYGWYKSV